MRTINEIIIHCSATPEGRHHTVGDIRSWHRQRGFKDVGYHYIIYIDGSIHAGRDESVIGAHTKYHNQHSIGVCYIGGIEKGTNKPKDTRTDAQKKALLQLLRQLRKKYPRAKIYGHRDFAAKACPCFDAKTEYANL